MSYTPVKDAISKSNVAFIARHYVRQKLRSQAGTLQNFETHVEDLWHNLHYMNPINLTLMSFL